MNTGVCWLKLLLNLMCGWKKTIKTLLSRYAQVPHSVTCLHFIALNVISACLRVSILHPYVQFVCAARPSLSGGVLKQ